MQSRTSNLSMFEMLEPRQLMSASLGHSLMNVAAPIDMPVVGEVSVAGAVELNAKSLYAITAKSHGTLIINAAGQDGMDPVLRIYSRTGKLIAKNDNAFRGTLDSQVKLHVNEGQILYVQVVDAKGLQGHYSIRLGSTPVDDYGNTIATAARWKLTSAGSGVLAGSINYLNDVDFLAITAPKTGQMAIDMNAYRSAGMDCELAIFGSDGSPIATNNDANGTLDAEVTFSVVAGQTYYVKATTHDGLEGSYRLITSLRTDVLPPPPPPPAPDPTDDSPVIPDPSAPTPGAAITANVVQTSQGLQLWIVGTESADMITVSQNGNDVTVTTTSSQVFTGAFSQIMIYGFGGNDTIRLSNSVTLDAAIYGGEGNDSIYVASQGRTSVFGEGGDDLIVTIGGGATTITGGAGMDSVWMDSGDTMTDASAAENAVGAIHKVTEFYQPYTTDRASSQYIPLTIAGQKFTDPSLTSSSLTYTNYSDRPLFVNGPDYTDIRQGGVGDCYMVASLASLAQSDPGVIRQMVTPLGDGTFAVRFYRSGKEVYLRMDGDLPTYSGGSLVYARLSAQGETWVAVVEKAYAYFRRGQNSYDSISGGWMSGPLTEFTNKSTTYMWTDVSATAIANYISSSLTAGHAVTAASSYSPGNPIVGSHAYMIKAIEITAGGTFVTVYNPWGIDGASYDSNSNDGLLRVTMDNFMSNFDAVVVCSA
jgi:hypothetical protein